MTLVELVVVIAAIAVIAVIATSRVSGVADRAKAVAARSDIARIAAAFMDESSGYIRDMRGIPGFSPALMRMGNLLVSTNVYGCSESGPWAGGFRVDAAGARQPGCAPPEAFTGWSEERERGWRGPYLRGPAAKFPAAGDVRHAGDETFAARGFFPDLGGLRLPADFLQGRGGCSAYGFPGEPALMDPWGNPYVLQIPPPNAFRGANTNISGEVRFRYARIVSAGPDGRLDTPCFTPNSTNWWATSWSERTRRMSRQAGLVDGDMSARGDDMVLFLVRSDVDEGEEAGL